VFAARVENWEIKLLELNDEKVNAKNTLVEDLIDISHNGLGSLSAVHIGIPSFQ
jgi:hypothetical protein